MTAPNVTPTPSPIPPNPVSTSGTPSTGAPAGNVSTPSGAQDTGFRYTSSPNVPDYLVGKNPAEAAALIQQLVDQNQKLASQRMGGYAPANPQPNYTGYTAPQNYPSNFGYAPPPAPIAKPTADDFIQRPAEATEQYANYIEQTRWNPQLQAQAANQAQMAREMVALRRPEDFKRYGPEIDLTLQKVAPDPSNWTPENINYVVDMVRGRHVDDLLAEERSRHQNALGGASARPDGGGGAPGSSPATTNAIDLEKLPANYQAALKRLNLDQHSIDEFLVGSYLKTGMEPNLDAARQRWVAQAQRGDIVTDGREFLSGVYQ